MESWEARRAREKAKGRNGNGFGVPLDMAVQRSSSSPVGSLANLIPLQESVKRLLTIVTSGPRLPVCFARFDRDGSSGRMCAVSSTPNLDGSLAPFSGTWPTWGIALDGACGELPTLERCTSESESSFWRTPQNRAKGGGEYQDPEKIEERWRRGHQVNLSEQVRMWPTPTIAGNYNKAGLSAKSGDGLATAVKMWPTPTANRRDGLQSHGVNAVSGSLNPTWVEWLMGFPLGWTALEPSEMPSSRSKRTRSSPKSPDSSVDVE